MQSRATFHVLWLPDRPPSTAFPTFESYRRINQPRPEERAPHPETRVPHLGRAPRRIARVSKDGHKRDRASGHPSRRRFAPPQDEVCGFKLHPPRSDWFDGIDVLGMTLATHHPDLFGDLFFLF